MNEEHEANSAAKRSPWLHAITTFTVLSLFTDGVAFWVILILAIFGVVPWIALLWVIGIASGIVVFAFSAAVALGAWHGMTKKRFE